MRRQNIESSVIYGVYEQFFSSQSCDLRSKMEKSTVSLAKEIE